MPSLTSYKKMLGNRHNGEARKIESDIIEESTFADDINYRIGWFYDYYTDNQKLLYRGLSPEKSKTKIPIEIKFISNAKNSESKDQVGYLIQFKPSFRWEDDKRFGWYKDRFVDRYDVQFPIGMFVDIPDEKGVYRKWLVTSECGWLDTQFPTWFVLPCDFVFQWVNDGILYQHCGVSRNQNSYNSGIWESRGGSVQTRVPENQRICLLPMNDISSTLFYDDRLVISQPIKTPITWKVTKVDNTNPKGITVYTFSQDRWNEHTDRFEYHNEDGSSYFSPIYSPNEKIWGMYADYGTSSILPEKPDLNPITEKVKGEFSWSAKPQVKVGGSYKKLTITFYDENEEIVEKEILNWEFKIDNEDASDVVETIEDGNVIKIKFTGEDSYIGKVLNVTCNTTDGISTSIELEILGL